MTMRHPLRTLEEVCEDGLWPSHGLGGPDPSESRRHQAIAEVLRSVPEQDYKKLRDSQDGFCWFIPHPDLLGGVHPFPITHREEVGHNITEEYAAVLCLSPMLERVAWDILVAVVAHELAHIVLGHELFPGPNYETQEEEAWALIRAWGFEREERKHRARATRKRQGVSTS